LSGVLDFENVIAGDPLLDLAKAVYYFTPEDEAKRVALFAGYGPIKRGDLQDTLAFFHCHCTLVLVRSNRKSSAAGETHTRARTIWLIGDDGALAAPVLTSPRKGARLEIGDRPQFDRRRGPVRFGITHATFGHDRASRLA
jgi:hypothetical protein